MGFDFKDFGLLIILISLTYLLQKILRKLNENKKEVLF